MNNTFISNSINTFQWADYLVFTIMLTISAIIGLYFGFFGKKQDSREEYLHGGRKMKMLPIVASLIASDISGITILGVPSDVYMFGSSFAWSALSALIANFAVVYIYLPVLYNLHLTSPFEYLKIRFSSRIRSIASVIYTINYILLVPIVIYTSILAFGQVSQINLNLLTVIVCISCTIYTTFGGLKAVVWTDTMQMCAMVGSLLFMLCLGVSLEPGGFKNVWETGLKGGRVDINSNIDPTNRTATFTIFFGFTAFYLSYGYNPIFVQRYLSLPTEQKSKLSAQLLCIGNIFFRTSSTFLGLIIYSRYSTCDPISTGSIQKLDQLVPYYIMDVASSLPGLPGLCIGGIFCASISTMSTLLNTSSGTIYEDLIKDRMPANTTEKRASDIMKITVAVLGIFCMFLVFLIQHLGGILELLVSVQGVITGPVLAMFTLGMLLPIVNEKGIFYGSIGASLIMLWIAVTSKYYAMTGQFVTKKLPLSTDGCLISSNFTVSNYTISNAYLESENPSEPFYLYRISFYYYTLMGVIVTTIIALPISWYTTKKKEAIDVNLFSPVISKLISKYNYQHRRQKLQDEKELDHVNTNLVDHNMIECYWSQKI